MGLPIACSKKMWYANKALHTEKEAEDELTISQAFQFFWWDDFTSVDANKKQSWHSRE